MNNTTDKCAEFFFPDGESAFLKTAARLVLFALIFWGGVIFLTTYLSIRANAAMDAQQAAIKLKREGIPENAVILVPVDNVTYDSSLIVKSLNIKNIKSPALRDYMTLKVNECKAKAPPKTSIVVPIAGGLYECWIDNQLVSTK